MRSFTLLFNLLIITIFFGCTDDPAVPSDTYACDIPDDAQTDHPDAGRLQMALEEATANGLIGQVAVIRNNEGTFMGAAGKADLASDIDMEVCHRMIIASCTKTFTATLIFQLAEEGLIDLNEPVSTYLPAAWIARTGNAHRASILQVLSHRSGIPDYYTARFELDRLDKFSNHFTGLDILAYTDDLEPEFEPGTTYSYSNTNYLLLGLVIEQILNTNLDNAFREAFFEPLGMASASFPDGSPDDMIKGYGAITDDRVIETERLYGDELGSGDGGLVMNTYDLATFIRALGSGQLLSPTSFAQMTDWFDLPDYWTDSDYGFSRNGFGLEYYQTPHGPAFGHFGGVDGFNSIMLYFPEQQTTFATMINGAVDFEGRLQFYQEAQRILFE